MNSLNTLNTADSLNTAVAGVISKMAVGVFVTMAFAAAVASLGIVPILFSGFLGYVIIFSPLVMCLIFALTGIDAKMSESAAKMWFFAFSAAMGLSLSLFFHVFAVGSIVNALIGTTASFGALALYGYFTKKDLSKFGPFLFAGVIGLIIASITNIFIASTALQSTLNILAIIIFLSLTAYDMNRIREMFWYTDKDEIRKMQWFAALSLYINFINIFMSILQLFGDKK